MYKKLILIVLLLPWSIHAQELLATVQVLSPNVQNTNKQVFVNMEQAIREFINNNAWTQERYEQQERLQCTFIFNITEQPSLNQFRATLQVQYSRPIYNSDYRSPLINILDNDIAFQYLENDRLEFIDNIHTSNLTSILAFYAYIIIGMDHDSFERGSGDPFYVKAQNVVNNAQNDPLGTGWRNFDGNTNRYWLADNLLNPAFKGLKDCYYEYHRNGLDRMYKSGDQKEAKESIINTLSNLQVVHQKRPNSYLMNVFFDAKVNEIVSIFSDGPAVDTSNLLKVLKLVDANNSQLYEKISRS